MAAFRTGHQSKCGFAQQRQPTNDRITLQFLERSLGIQPLMEAKSHVFIDRQATEHTPVLEGACETSFGNIRHTKARNGFTVNVDQSGIRLDEA